MTVNSTRDSSRLSPLRDKIINPATRGLRPRFARNNEESFSLDHNVSFHNSFFFLQMIQLELVNETFQCHSRYLQEPGQEGCEISLVPPGGSNDEKRFATIPQ